MTTGLTGSALDCLLVNSGIFTCTVRGSTSTPVTTWFEPSTARASISVSTSRPLGSRLTLTVAATTWLTSEAGPVTVTSAGSVVGSPTATPEGAGPRTTRTGTVLVVRTSSTTWICCGCTSTIVTRGSSGVTITRTVVGWPSGLTLVRSTVARKSWASCRGIPAGARYRIWSTSCSWLVTTVFAGGFTALIVIGPRSRLLSCEATRPA